MITPLAEISRSLRRDILHMFHRVLTGRLVSSLSCVDILTALYFGGVVDRRKLDSPERDRVILSKGHAGAALYAVLSRLGLLGREELWTFSKNGSQLPAFLNPACPGLEFAGASLGQGLCFATGTALAAKLDRQDYRTYAIIGEGETQEGSTWEAALFAANHRLNNLVFIMDRNQMQATGPVEDIASLGSVADKWRAFGWLVAEAPGHDPEALAEVLKGVKNQPDSPTLVIAHTVKGRGLSLVEGVPDAHCWLPRNEADWLKSLDDLGRPALEPEAKCETDAPK